ARLLAGDDVALVSDAGTPAISDPGVRLVAACVAAGVTVSPIPGPSALAAILSVCGLDTQRISFFGFPPSKARDRRSAFEALAERVETLVFYESPHRVLASLADMAEAWGGDRPAVLGRELTKMHEEVVHG